jgi:hypothetical protein
MISASTERGGYSRKILKKSLAMPIGIVTRGVILQVLGG